MPLFVSLCPCVNTFGSIIYLYFMMILNVYELFVILPDPRKHLLDLKNVGHFGIFINV
jgi:hypothetical protein